MALFELQLLGEFRARDAAGRLSEERAVVSAVSGVPSEWEGRRKFEIFQNLQDPQLRRRRTARGALCS